MIPVIAMRAATDLIPYARNARTHSEQQVAMIAGSIREFGFRNPVLVDGDNGIIAGHARVQAALKLNLAKVPCIDCSDMSDTQRRAYILADNRLALNAGWDQELLALELTDLSEMDVDLEGLGFSEVELHKLLGYETQEGEDEVPDIEVEVVSKLGEVWQLGPHRLMCGDATNAEHVAQLLADAKPHLMVTDQPYGVSYDPSWMVAASAEGKIHGGTKTRGKVGLIENDDRSDWGEVWSLFPGNIAYVWHASLLAGDLISSLEDLGFKARTQIIWAKDSFTIGRGDYHWQHETCLYSVKGTGRWRGDRSQSSLWSIPKVLSDTGHSTQKPVECMRRPILNNSSPGQAVYEPFSGSGTTIIAAETTGRACYAMEISPAYVDMAVRRWQEFAGEQAMRQDDGSSFDDCTLRAA